jgi:hypothetical protein
MHFNLSQNKFGGVTMRFIFIAIAALLFSPMAFANSYTGCQVDNVLTHESIQNYVIVTMSCVAPDAATTGVNCTAGAINPRAFIFDASTVTGKAHLSLVLTALASGNSVTAATYGGCLANVPDTLTLYSLKLFKQ